MLEAELAAARSEAKRTSEQIANLEAFGANLKSDLEHQYRCLWSHKCRHACRGRGIVEHQCTCLHVPAILCKSIGSLVSMVSLVSLVSLESLVCVWCVAL